jgi:hypothetical protein
VAVTHDGGHPHEEWVSLSVEAKVPADATAPDAKPPNLVRLLLDGMDAFDGEAELRSRPALVSSARVDELLDIVCSEERRLPTVIAAAPADVDFESWRAATERLMYLLPGLASMYILDPAAAVLFNNGIGPTHWIGPGSARTYLPGVDPAVDADAVRHRVLSRRRIDTEPSRARYLLAALPRQLAATAVPPSARIGLAPTLSDFARGGIAAPAVDEDEISRLRDDVKLLNDLLAEASNTERQLNEEIGRQQDDLMDLAHELEVAQQDLDRSTATIRTLRQRLVESGRPLDAYAPIAEPPPLPTSFDELYSWLDGITSYVEFTGDTDEMLGLDVYPQNATWAQTAWQCFLALRDYAQAKKAGDFTGDFKMWCETPHGDGRVIAPGKVARDESPTVRNTKKYAAPRTFPVPAEVDPSKRIFMGAHIRLGADAQLSPRMHYHDATSTVGKVFVGYVGRHLPNTLTS